MKLLVLLTARLRAVAEHLPQGDALLDVAAGGGRGVRADDVDVLGVESAPC